MENYTIKRTIDGKRVLLEINIQAKAFTEKLIKKYQSLYLSLWRKPSLTWEERKLFEKIDRVLANARKREVKPVGTWQSH